MKHAPFRSIAMTILPVAAGLMVATLWACSISFTFGASKTFGKSFWYVELNQGRVLLFVERPWWRRESLFRVTERTNGMTSLHPNWHYRSRLSFLGFEYASGKRDHQQIRVMPGMPLLPPFDATPIGGLLQPRPNLVWCVIPLWLLLVPVALIPLCRAYSRHRRRKRRLTDEQPSGDTVAVEAPPTTGLKDRAP